jgi:hypothetical protein
MRYQLNELFERIIRDSHSKSLLGFFLRWSDISPRVVHHELFRSVVGGNFRLFYHSSLISLGSNTLVQGDNLHPRKELR